MRFGISIGTRCSIRLQPFGLLNSRNLYKWQVILDPFGGMDLYLQGIEQTKGLSPKRGFVIALGSPKLQIRLIR
jgi:hypothetical protein